MAATSFRKPHLNTLREATVAQAPRAHFDPCRSEGPFFSSRDWASHGSLALPDVWRPDSFLRLILLSPLVIASGSFSGAGARPGVFQDTSGEKQKISHGNWITPPLQNQSHTLHTLLPLMPKRRGVFECVWRTLGLFWVIYQSLVLQVTR